MDGRFLFPGKNAIISTSYLPCQIQGEKATMLIDKLNIPEKIEILAPGKEKTVLLPPQKKESMREEIRENSF